MVNKLKNAFESKAAMVGAFAILITLVAVVWGMVFISGQSASPPEKAINTQTEEAPVIKKQSKVGPKSVASFQLYRFKDPFDPLVRASATQSGSGNGTGGVSGTSAYDPKDEYGYTDPSSPTSTTSSDNSDPGSTPNVSTNETGQTCSATVTLNGIVEVADEMYASVELRRADCVVEDFTVIEGDVFATTFKVLDINDQGILLLYGDERFDLELNQSKEL